jgi:hypothetical protein
MRMGVRLESIVSSAPPSDLIVKHTQQACSKHTHTFVERFVFVGVGNKGSLGLMADIDERWVGSA